MPFEAHHATLAEQLAVVLDVVWAMALGVLIGTERQRANKAAGTRTHALIAGAAALVTSMSSFAVAVAGNGDATRGLHAVVTGIGFLGAGAIIQRKNGTTGLTTAATLFFSACVGAGVGMGFGVTATLSALLAVVLVFVLGQHRYHDTHDDDATDDSTGGRTAGEEGSTGP